MPRRKRLVVVIAGAAGVCVVGLLVVSGFDQSATPKIAGATATTASEMPTTSNTVTTVTSTTDRLAQQERPSTTGGDIVSKCSGRRGRNTKRSGWTRDVAYYAPTAAPNRSSVGLGW